MLLGESIPGALVEFFSVYQVPYRSYRNRGFRIPSCYGQLKSLTYLQRHGNDCALAHLSSTTGDVIDLYEYNVEEREWRIMSLLNSTPARLTCVSIPSTPFMVLNDELQALFARQILIGSSDGSLLSFDTVTLQRKERCSPTDRPDLFRKQTEYFVRIQHTPSGRSSEVKCISVSHVQFSRSPSFRRFLLPSTDPQWSDGSAPYDRSASNAIATDAPTSRASFRTVHRAAGGVT